MIRLLLLILVSLNLAAQGILTSPLSGEVLTSPLSSSVLTSGTNDRFYDCDYSLGLRLAELNKKWYIVEYRYKKCGVHFMPAILGAQPHFFATITVRHRGKDIAVFDGQYTEKGCFEDDPEMLVKKALKIRERKLKSKAEAKQPTGP